MDREIAMIAEAQRLLRLASNNLKQSETLDVRPLDIIRRNLNEFIRELQYSDISEE